jgi:hypothetical protein
VVVEASLGNMFVLEVLVEVGAIRDKSASRKEELSASPTYLNSLSSSITWTPCEKLPVAGTSPTAEKWPFMMREGPATAV